MKKHGLRAVSFVLSFLMVAAVFTSLPISAGAAETGVPDESVLDEQGYYFNEETRELTVKWPSGLDAYKSCAEELGEVACMTVRKTAGNYQPSTDSYYLFGHAFQGFDKVKKAVIEEDSFDKVSWGCFEDCSALEEVVLPQSVKIIDENAFRGCSALKAVNIPSDVVSIGREAFKGCASLQSVTIPVTVTDIGVEAFFGCSGLTALAFEDVGNGAVAADKQLTIESSAFSNCSSLTELHFPRRLAQLDSYAFSGNTSLKEVRFPDTALEGKESITLGKNIFNICGIDIRISVPEAQTAYFREALPESALFINAAADFRVYPVEVNGEIFTSDKTEIACGDGWARFDASTSTLTLHNAQISNNNRKLQYLTTPESYYDGNNSYSVGGCAIDTALESLTLVLEGENSFVYAGEAYGVIAEHDLTVKGGGSLVNESGLFIETTTHTSAYLLARGDLSLENVRLYGINLKGEGEGSFAVRDCDISADRLETRYYDSVSFENSAIGLGKLILNSGYDPDDETGNKHCDFAIKGCELMLEPYYSGTHAVDLYENKNFTLTVDGSDITVKNASPLDNSDAAEHIVLTGGCEILEGGWTDNGMHIGFADPPEKTYSVKIDSVIPGEAAAAVTLRSGDEEWTAARSEDGSYLAEASNKEEVTLTVSAEGYVPRRFTFAAGTLLDRRLGAVRLYPCPENGIISTHLAATDGRTLLSFDGLNPVLSNDKRKLTEGEDYRLSYPNIILSESYRKSVRKADILHLTLKPDEDTRLSWAYLDTNLSDRDFKGEIDAWAKIQVTVNSDYDGMNHVVILNRNGVAESGMVRSGDTYVSDVLDSDNYTVLAYNENDIIGAVDSSNTLYETGFEQGTDFAGEWYVDHQTGRDTELTLNVPVLDTSRFTDKIDKAYSSVQITSQSVQLGKNFRARVEYAFSDKSVSDGKVVIPLPDSIELINVCMDGRLLAEDTDYTVSPLTIPVSRYSGVIYLTLRPLRSTGTRTISAALAQGESLIPFGSVNFKVLPSLTLSAPSTVDGKTFTVRVQGEAESTVYFEINGESTGKSVRTNKAGNAEAELEVPEKANIGSEFSVTAKSGRSTADAKVTYFREKSKVENFYFEAVRHDITEKFWLVKDGKKSWGSYYSVRPDAEDDPWTFTAEIRDSQNSLQTEDIDVILDMSDESVEYVRLRKVKSEKSADGSVLYTFRGITVQPGYEKNEPYPVRILLAFNDVPQGELSFDTSVELDMREVIGAKDEIERAERLREEIKRDIGQITLKKTCGELFAKYEEESSFGKLTEPELKNYRDLRGKAEGAKEEEYDYNWAFTKSYMISDKAGFDSLTDAQKNIIYQYEEIAEELIIGMSSQLLLKRPLYEYGNIETALKETGVTVTRSYTGSRSGFIQIDKNLWLKEDRDGNRDSIINTAEKLRLDVDYNVIENRYAELQTKVNAAFGKPSKAGDSVGIPEEEAADVTYGWFMKISRESSKAISASDNPFSEVVGRAEDFLASSYCSVAENKLGELGKEYSASVLPKLENNLNTAVKSGKGIENVASEVSAASRNINAIGYLEKGAHHMGTAINIKGAICDTNDMLGNKFKSVEMKNRKEELLGMIADALQSGQLTFEESLDLKNFGEAIKHDLDDLRMGYSNESRYKAMSLISSATCNPYTNLAFQGFTEYYMGPLIIKARGARQGLEEDLEKNIRAALELIHKADKRSATGKKKRKLDPWSRKYILDYALEFRGVIVPTSRVVDPSGIVYEGLEDNVLDGVTATIRYSPDKDGSNAEIWKAEDFSQINPQITTASGYSWDVPDGFWQVRFEKDGFLAAQTDWLPVPPPQLNLKTPMISTEKPRVESAAAYPDYIEIAFTQYMDVSKLPVCSGCRAEWIDPAQAPDGKQLSKLLRLIPEKGASAVGGKLDITLSGAVNYAGTKADDYKASLTVINRPVRIELSTDAPETYMGGSVSLTARIIGADGKTAEGLEAEVSLSSDIADISVTPKDGAFTVKADGKDIGSAVLTVRVKGTEVTKKATLIVYGSETELAPILAKGDVNGDGKITIDDATLVQKAIAEIVALDSAQKYAADTNRDGEVTISDVTQIQKYVAEIIDHF